MKELYASKVILHQRSCVNTPQQNFLVERKHRHRFETSRALFFQSGLPIKYWEECALSTVHLIMPLQLLNFISPYEKLYHTPPNLSYLKVFGCLCFASSCSTNRYKFDSKAQKCIFLGYPTWTKGYRFFDIQTSQIFIFRDVTFHEQHFPFHLTNLSSPTNKPPSFFLTLCTEESSFLDIILPDAFYHRNDNFTDDYSPGTSPNHDVISQNNDDTLNANVPLIKSTRTVKMPTSYTDYIYINSQANIGTTHWCNLVSYSALPSPLQALVSQHASLFELSCYAEASHDPRWIAAMDKELQVYMLITHGP